MEVLAFSPTSYSRLLCRPHAQNTGEEAKVNWPPLPGVAVFINGSMSCYFRMMKTYRKLEAAILQLDYFTQNYWDVSTLLFFT